MAEDSDLSSGAVLLLLRIDRADLVRAAKSSEISVTEAHRRFSGIGLPWYHLECAGIRIRLNGVVALADGACARQLEDRYADVWFELDQRLPVILGARRRTLATLYTVTPDDLAALEYYSAGVEMLGRLTNFAVSRPRAAGQEIADCERWLRGRFAQYLTGRGALRNVVLPWISWLVNYEYLIGSLDRELAQLDKQLTLPPAGPLYGLASELSLLATGRDRESIVREYRSRLENVTGECNRVAAEIGMLGTFGSLALVPVESQLGLFFLAPVAVAGVAYYGGHAIMRAVTRTRRRRISRSRARRMLPAGEKARRPEISNILRELLQQPVTILADSRLGAVDIACALELRHQLLERTRCADPLSAITVAAADAGRAGLRVVIGGPLVRVPLAEAGTPACDLTDRRGTGWEILAGEHRIAGADDDETVGCCAIGSDARTLYVFGVRDSGTALVIRWLAGALDNTEMVADTSWLALHRGRNGAPAELSRG